MTQATNILETVTNMLFVVSLMQNPVILCTWADKQASSPVCDEMLRILISGLGVVSV